MVIDDRPFRVTLCDRCMQRFERHVIEAGRPLSELDDWLVAICPRAALDGFCLTEAMEADKPKP